MKKVDSLSVSVLVHNNEYPRWYYREGFVEVSLEKLRASQSKSYSDLKYIEFKDERGNQVQAQLDITDPKDRAKDVIVFLANLSRGSKKYYISEGEGDSSPKLSQPRIRDVSKAENWDFEMENDQILLRFRRGEHYHGNFGGSIYEIAFKGDNEWDFSPFEPNYFQKFMQIEHISFPFSQQPKFILTGNYEVVNKGEGPNRCFLTIRCPLKVDFEYPLPSGPGKFIKRYDCNLYRIISLYSNKNHINEEIYCESMSKTLLFNKSGIETEIKGDQNIKSFLNFKVNFLMNTIHLDALGKKFKVHEPKDHWPILGWFAVANDTPEQRPGIGFASNCHIIRDKNFGYDGPKFRWSVSSTWHLKCLHLFR